MAQTSVEWYAEQLEIYEEKALIREITLWQLHIKKQELIAQSKEMHKTEITKAYQHASLPNFFGKLQPDEYYNKTFKKLKIMTEEKLKRANDLSKQIQDIKENIRVAKLTQSETMVIRPMYIEFLQNTPKLIAPESIFRIIGKLILNEHQQKLIELENEFNNL